MITTVINPFDGLLSKYFVNLDPVLNSHYEMAAPITFSGDFEIECELSTTSTSSYNLIISPTSDSTWLALRGTGLVQMRVSPTDYLLSTSIINDGKLHKIKITKINNQFKMYIDEVLEDTSNSTSPYTSSFSFIGKWYNTQHYFDGIIANVKFTDQSGASDVTTTFKLNNSPAAANYTYSTELLDNNTFTNGTTDWYSPRSASSLSIINNKLVSIADSAATFGAAQPIDNLIVGNAYRFVGTATCSNSSAQVYLRVGTDFSIGVYIFQTSGGVGGVSTIDTQFIATATTMYFGMVVTNHAANDTVTIDAGITVKEITNYTEANADDTWVGSNELVVNGDFATASDWSASTGWSISGGAANGLNIAAGGQSLSQSGVLETGAYLSSITTSASSSGSLLVVAGGGGGTLFSNISTVGTFTSAINVSGTNGTLYINGSDAPEYSGSIDNISIKKIIEVAS